MNDEFSAAQQTEQVSGSAESGQNEAAKKGKTIKKNVYRKLMAVQQSLKAHKGQHNDYGNYNYRSAEDILEAVKPLLLEQEAIILINDEIFNLNNQVNREKGDNGTELEMPCNYIKATVRFIDCESGQELSASAYAKECRHTGMSADQCTGCASSYARKYALNALLCIDNTADSDSNAVAEIEQKARAQQQAAQSANASAAKNAPAAKTWGKPAQSAQQNRAPQSSGKSANGWGQSSGWGQKAANG